jgi:hypothetical protein
MPDQNHITNLEDKLQSGKTSTILTALLEIKESGNIYIIPLLLELLKSNPEQEVKQEIANILGNLKLQAAVPILIEAIQNPVHHSIQKELIIACWQNGLNFESYLSIFVDLVIKHEWETGFEAFTVIENMENFPDREIIDLCVNKIHIALPQARDRKKYLLQEILLLIC